MSRTVKICTLFIISAFFFSLSFGALNINYAFALTLYNPDGTAYYRDGGSYYNQEVTTYYGNNSGQVICTMEVRICGDGSSVSRTAPNCEFAACPSGSYYNQGINTYYSSWGTPYNQWGNTYYYGNSSQSYSTAGLYYYGVNGLYYTPWGTTRYGW